MDPAQMSKTNNRIVPLDWRSGIVCTADFRGVGSFKYIGMYVQSFPPRVSLFKFLLKARSSSL